MTITTPASLQSRLKSSFPNARASAVQVTPEPVESI